MNPTRLDHVADVRRRIAAGFYDRPDVLTVAAADLLAREDVYGADDSLPSRIARQMEEDGERWDGLS